MQDQDGDCGRESAAGKRKCRCIPLDDGGRVSGRAGESRSERMVVFQAGQARHALAEFGGSGAGARADFEQVVAEVRAAQYPRE